MLDFNYPKEIPLGDACSIPFALTNPDATATTPATPYDYTGHVLKLFIGETPFDNGGVYLVTKSTIDGGITAVTPSLGVGNLNFLPADAAVLVGKTYYYGFRDETAQQTLSRGTIAFGDHQGR